MRAVCLTCGLLPTLSFSPAQALPNLASSACRNRGAGRAHCRVLHAELTTGCAAGITATRRCGGGVLGEAGPISARHTSVMSSMPTRSASPETGRWRKWLRLMSMAIPRIGSLLLGGSAQFTGARGCGHSHPTAVVPGNGPRLRRRTRGGTCSGPGRARPRRAATQHDRGQPGLPEQAEGVIGAVQPPGRVQRAGHRGASRPMPASRTATHRAGWSSRPLGRVPVTGRCGGRPWDGPAADRCRPGCQYPPPELAEVVAAGAAAPEAVTSCHTPPERFRPLPLACPGAASAT
jgi:hypothetical protein